MQYSAPELPWFKQATLEHKSAKTKAQVLAELFRLMAKDRSYLALIGEIRAMGVSFKDPAPNESREGPIRDNAKQVLTQVGDSAKSAPSIVASILMEDKPDVFAASGITVDHGNPVLKEKLTATVEVEGVIKSPNPASRRPSGENNSNGVDSNNGDDDIRVKKKKIGPASVMGRPSLASPAKPSKPAIKKRIPPDQLESLKRSFHAELPTDRFARTDIVRYLFHTADGQKISLLTRVGITFDYESGSYVQGRGAFDEDRAMRFSEKLAHLIDVQWAVVLAEATFRLLDPKETRSLELAGIKVDADNPKTPLFYRLERAVRKEMMAIALGQTDGNNLAPKMAKQFNLNTSLTHVKAVESAFGVSNKEALKFLERGVKGIKTYAGPSANGAKRKPEFNVPSGISITPQKTPTTISSKPKQLSPATKKRIIEGDADGGDEDADWTPSKKARRKCVTERKVSYVGDDDDNDDVVDLSD